MNIHVRTIGRLLKNMFIPAVIGAIVGMMFSYLSANQILLILTIGLIAFLFYLFYNWTLDQIRQEDQLKAHLSSKE